MRTGDFKTPVALRVMAERTDMLLSDRSNPQAARAMKDVHF